ARSFVAMLFVLLLAAALPLAPYLLSEKRLDSLSNAAEHSHHPDHPLKSEHPHCLKCVLALALGPLATAGVTTGLSARALVANRYLAPYLELLFDPNTGARAPPA
ncbi:MAG: hypothetical protein M3498_02085, partial [Deinococcota bacterium]|nr:hypothetical protein [Deinococcota bacterium]